MILQKVWNECVQFGGHVNIQVSYKILQLEIPIQLVFKRGYFEATLDSMQPPVFRG
jgi:hypothetical protein